ncbi:MAG: phosphate acyltransferase, partial [Defluviitaleaceae bacterium]|nr:phosphate acyltransferase [Defluviitaleaceae bacterium]
NYLYQFAVMGSAYAQKMMGIEKPRVGLVNIGAEKEKGNELAKEAFALLETADINFTGNAEARDIPSGVVDVAVCDGFVGNVILKYTEGLASSLMDIIKEALTTSGFKAKLGAMLSKPAYRKIKKKFDYAEVGGAPFLGLNALVIKAHGSSNAKAIAGALGQVVAFAQSDASAALKYAAQKFIEKGQPEPETEPDKNREE